jgi:hypothetical protein
VFAITFPFLANTDIVVYQNSTKLVLGGGAGQYGLSGAGTASGGTMTLVTGATVNDIITIYGDTPVDRTSIYSPTVSNLTGDDLNSDFNRDIIMIKQQQTTQDYLQLKYAPYAQVSQDDTVTLDRWLPILTAGGIWRKNAGNTAIEVATVPEFPVGSFGANFTDANRLVRTKISAGNEIQQMNIELTDALVMQSTAASWSISSAIDLNLTATQYLNLNGQRWPASIGTNGQVVGVAAGVLAYLNVASTSAATIANQIPMFINTTGALDDSPFAVSGNDLLLPNDPSVALAAATKQYVDAATAGAALSKTDDTNVTLTLGGTPLTALLRAASITAGWTGTLAMARGGAGVALTAADGGIVYSDADSLAILAPTATANQIVMSGSNTAPAWSTATYPATTTINQLLYSSANNVIAGLATANSAALVTTVAGVPVFTSSLTDGQVVIGVTGGTPVGASLSAGSGVTITPGAGTITIAATGSGGTVTSVSGTANQIDVANGTTTPSLTLSSTVVFPGTVTLNADPVSAMQAVTKQYADALIAGLDFKGACVAASTIALTVTYDNGASGVGATLTNADTQAAFSLDGQSPSATQRVLIKNQASTFQNGIYTVTDVGSGATNWVLTRTTDYDAPAEITPGDLVPISAGTVNANTLWLQTATVAAVGTDPVTFSQFSSAPLALPVAVTSGGTGLSSTTINQILYSSAANTIAGLATANSAVLVTGATGVPVFSGTMTDGQLIIGDTSGTPVAASLTAGSGITITPGAGSITIAASGGSSKLIQTVYTSTSTPTSNSSNIPCDTSIPQVGEGTQLFSQAITPTSASSLLIIEVAISMIGRSSASTQWVGALFQDGAANAVAVGIEINSDSVARCTSYYLQYIMVAGTTSATTFTLRYGCDSGTAYVLQSQDGSVTMGGKGFAFLKITEITA